MASLGFGTSQMKALSALKKDPKILSKLPHFEIKSFVIAFYLLLNPAPFIKGILI